MYCTVCGDCAEKVPKLESWGTFEGYLENDWEKSF